MRRNRSVPDVVNKRKNWTEHISENDVNNLVFLDESGVNTDMTNYARSKKSKGLWIVHQLTHRKILLFYLPSG